MGLFDGTSAQTTSAPPEWMQQLLQQYLQQASNVANKPYQQYEGMQVAPFTPLQEQAFGGIQDTMYGSPAMDASQGFLANLIANGGGPNGGLEGVLSRTRRGVTDAYDAATGRTTAMFNEPGQWGGSAHMQAVKGNQDALAQGLGDAEAGLRYQDYTGDLQRRMSAAGMAPQLATTQQNLFANGLNAGNYQQNYGQALVDAQRGDGVGRDVGRYLVEETVGEMW